MNGTERGVASNIIWIRVCPGSGSRRVGPFGLYGIVVRVRAVDAGGPRVPDCARADRARVMRAITARMRASCRSRAAAGSSFVVYLFLCVSAPSDGDKLGSLRLVHSPLYCCILQRNTAQYSARGVYYRCL